MRATPAVMRIVLVVLLILGFVLIGSLSMRYNEMQKQTETRSGRCWPQKKKMIA